MTHTHWPGGLGPKCKLTKKDCDAQYADWQAEREVALAAGVVSFGRAAVTRYKGETSAFAQMVLVLAGEKRELEGETPYAQRLRAALARRMEARSASTPDNG